MKMLNKGTCWAAAMALAVGMTSSASAADLGGNCCADLEERIAELEATTARKGTRKVSLEISGWLNKTLLFWDDSIRKDVYAGIDNDAASSRWRFVGSAKITPDVSAGFLYEFNSFLGLTSAVNQTNGGDDRGYATNTTLRQANVWVESKRLGRVTIGQASQATDGIAEIDLSRTEAVSGSGVSAWLESFILNANGAYTGSTAINLFIGTLDGGRTQLVRYDSPIFAGFRVSASSGLGGEREGVSTAIGGPSFNEWDVALRYAAEFNSFRFAAGVGYHQGVILDTANFTWARPATTVMGSASLLHVPSGLFLTGSASHASFDERPAAGFSNFEGNEFEMYYVKGGWLANIVPVGQTSFYGEYYAQHYSATTDAGATTFFPGANYTSQMWGAGIVQHIDAAAMEVYVAYRHYDTPTVGGLNFGDFDMGQVGMRIKF
ncbi:MAG: hypothetical protein ABI391_02970 [Hyphomicrobiaceae bacterium]